MSSILPCRARYLCKIRLPNISNQKATGEMLVGVEHRRQCRLGRGGGRDDDSSSQKHFGVEMDGNSGHFEKTLEGRFCSRTAPQWTVESRIAARTEPMLSERASERVVPDVRSSSFSSGKTSLMAAS